jgi:hypothetical protein
MVRSASLLQTHLMDVWAWLGSLWYATALVASLSIGFLVGVNYARNPGENSHLDSSLSADEDCKMVA